MADEADTKVDTAPDGQGNNDVDTEGNTDTDSGKDTNNQEKKLTQSEVNEVVKRAKLDAERSAKTKFEKSLEGKHVLTEDELSAKVKESVDAALKEENLKAIRLKIKDEYGLDDYKISKLEGDDENSLREDADKTYGKPKKSAPVLNGGADNSENGEIQTTYAQRSQKQLQDIKKKFHIK